MKTQKIRLCKVFMLCIVLLMAGRSLYAQHSKPFVIPELKEWKGESGYFIPGETTKIICDAQNKELLRIAKSFASDYKTMFGKVLEVSSGKASDGDFILKLKKDKQLGEEGYNISINCRVTVTSPTVKGIYWSTRTLLQMAEQQEQQQLPKGYIRDFPDYALRGFMLDCGRKFIPMAYLNDLIKIMSYYKMNTFQIHLNDNQFPFLNQFDWEKTYAAFRLESETYPGLTARDGFYTKKEFYDFQKKAMAQFVEIIPEIDAPAHALAFTHYKPEIGSKEYGMDYLDLFNPETYKFMDGLFEEYLGGEDPVFCGSKVHIGTDEYYNRDQTVVEKFRAYTDRYIKLIESYGKQACMWGALSVSKGETPVKSENVILDAWNNWDVEPKAMAKLGYKLISIPDSLLYIVPEANHYYNYLRTDTIYKNWTPAHIADVTFAEKDPAILGGMFALWNDHVGNGISVKDIHHRVFPAIQTLVTKMWTGTSVTIPFEKFETERIKLSEAPGINQLGRIGKEQGLVYEMSEVKSGMKTPYTEIGYDYTVSFDIEAIDEKKGTELFYSPNAVFYLSDPINGSFAFSRDGYLNSFDYRLYNGEKAHVEIQGNNKETILKVNGKVVSQLNKRIIYMKKGEYPLTYISTLFFPLEKTGNFKSKIFNLKVYNYLLGQD